MDVLELMDVFLRYRTLFGYVVVQPNGIQSTSLGHAANARGGYETSVVCSCSLR